MAPSVGEEGLEPTRMRVRGAPLDFEGRARHIWHEHDGRARALVPCDDRRRLRLRRELGDVAAGGCDGRDDLVEDVDERGRTASAGGRRAFVIVLREERNELREQLVALVALAGDEHLGREPIEARVRACVISRAVVENVGRYEKAELDRQIRDEAGHDARGARHCRRCAAVDRDVFGSELRVDVGEKLRQAAGVDDEVDASVRDLRRHRDATEGEEHDVLDAYPHLRSEIGSVQRFRHQLEQRVIRADQEEGNGAQLFDLVRIGRRVAGDLEGEARGSLGGHLALGFGCWLAGRSRESEASRNGCLACQSEFAF